jgi:hypothetical protein
MFCTAGITEAAVALRDALVAAPGGPEPGIEHAAIITGICAHVVRDSGLP